MDYRGTAIAGIWIGSAIIIGVLSYFGEYGGFAIPLIILDFVLTGALMRQDPGGEMGAEMKAKMENVGERVSALEKKVDEIKKLLEE
jgi:hypothetical protein